MLTNIQNFDRAFRPETGKIYRLSALRKKTLHSGKKRSIGCDEKFEFSKIYGHTKDGYWYIGDNLYLQSRVSFGFVLQSSSCCDSFLFLALTFGRQVSISDTCVESTSANSARVLRTPHSTRGSEPTRHRVTRTTPGTNPAGPRLHFHAKGIGIED